MWWCLSLPDLYQSVEGTSWLRGPRLLNKKPKLLKLHSTIVIKMIHEYAPSCSKNSAEVAMSMHQPLVNTIIFN